MKTVRQMYCDAMSKTDVNRYRKYAESKAQIPVGLSAEEYEAEVKRLAKKYKI